MNKIEKAYNSWAKIYDTNDNKTRDLDKKASIETLSKYHFSQVLELGSGTGKNTLFLLKKAQKIVCLDFSDEMLKKAKEKIQDERVVFQKADLNNEWKLNDATFDLITCSLTLEHIENLDFIFNQANLNLTDSGHFFVCELHPYKQYSGSKARYEGSEGIEVLQTYTHHLTDYLSAAQNNSFKLVELNEWFDEDNNLPRLISFVFCKNI
ncbi:MAG: class I SAM-dependent methyltransferase [Bacteroidales bacterium]|nr:class I SAM-dependent methyltransferase [Bacteroidales bacterium]